MSKYCLFAKTYWTGVLLSGEPGKVHGSLPAVTRFLQLLSWVMDLAAEFDGHLRDRVDQYLTSVRDLEKRPAKVEKWIMGSRGWAPGSRRSAS